MGPVANVEGVGPVANVEGWVLLLMWRGGHVARGGSCC